MSCFPSEILLIFTLLLSFKGIYSINLYLRFYIEFIFEWLFIEFKFKLLLFTLEFDEIYSKRSFEFELFIEFKLIFFLSDDPLEFILEIDVTPF